MPKKHKSSPKESKQKHSNVLPLPARAFREFDEAYHLLQKQQWQAAIEILEPMNRRHPNRIEILTGLSQAYYELGERIRCLQITEQLVQLVPGDDDFLFNLAGLYMNNVFPSHALQTFRRLLQRWPNHEQREEIQQSITVLEQMVNQLLAETGLGKEADAYELALLHEEIQILQAREKYTESRQAALELIRRVPTFLPPRNNLSLILMAEGELAAAQETAQQVLEIDPNNYHALSNLTRFCCMSGDFETARIYAQRLQSVHSESVVDLWTKKAEAFSFLGDDRAVLAVFEAAKKAGHLKPPFEDAFLYHLTAVAKMRLGDEKAARDCWKKALEISPGFHLAQENHLDLYRPLAERNVPWAFSFQYWIHEKARAGLEKLIRNLSGKMTNEGVIKMINQYLRDFPEVEALLPTLFARGDAQARQFAHLICTTAGRQDLLEILKQFVFSQDGPMKLRQEAALELYKKGVLASKQIRLWDGQEWHELILLAFEMTDEPSYDHSPQAERLLMQATKLLRQGKADEAEPFLLQAIELEPEAPDLKNNLGAAYELQGRTKEGYALARDLFENYPDYLFGRINMAKLYIKDRKLEEAREILDAVMLMDKMHLLEFGSLCQAQIEYSLVKKENAVAESWLNLWEQMDPDHPGIETMRMRIQRPNLLNSLWRGFS